MLFIPVYTVTGKCLHLPFFSDNFFDYFKQFLGYTVIFGFAF